MKRVHVLEVAEPQVWREIEALVDLTPLVEAELDPRRRAVKRGSERAIVPALRKRGLTVLVRPAPGPAAEPEPVAEIPPLPPDALRLLHKAQRRAVRGVFAGARVWHPVTDRSAIAAIVDSGLVTPVHDEEVAGPPVPRTAKLTLLGSVPRPPAIGSPLGAWALAPGLPDPPEPPWDLDEALFDPPDDLVPGPRGLLTRLHDAAALAAAIRHVVPRRTHQGHLDRAGGRQLGRRLHDRGLTQTGDFDRADPRWSQALDLLIGFDAVTEDPVQRTLHVRDSTLDAVLQGTPGAIVERALRRVAPPEVSPLLGALRAAIRQAGDRAVDEVVLLDLLAEQQGGTFADDEDTFRREEGPLLHDGITLLHGLGLIRRATGAFAATADGMAWAGCDLPPPPPVWITSDLELVVPPGTVTPLQRYLLERLARPVARDVVDRLRLERDGLADWLTDRGPDEALALLRSLAPAVPFTVVDTVRSWASGLTRVVLVTDVMLELPDAPV